MLETNSATAAAVTQSIAHRDITTLTSDTFRQQYQIPGNPVVITGLQPDRDDWTLDYLCQKLGDRELPVRFCGRERYQQDKRQWTDIGAGIESQLMPFSQYAESLRDRTAHAQDRYLARYPLKGTPLATAERLSAIGAHLGFVRPTSDVSLWAGPADHVEALHYDPVDVLLQQLHGMKRVVLFPPAQTANLYPFPLRVHLRYGLRLRSWCSQLYPEHPDFKAFPNFKAALAHRYEITLTPGDVLYIPVGWWHEVTTIGDVMICSVNQTWSVQPSIRALRSWNRWRILLGAAFAIPHTLASLMIATLSRTRTRSVNAIIRRF